MGEAMTEREISERLRLLDVLLASKRVIFDPDLEPWEMVEKISEKLQEAVKDIPRLCRTGR